MICSGVPGIRVLRRWAGFRGPRTCGRDCPRGRGGSISLRLAGARGKRQRYKTKKDPRSVAPLRAHEGAAYCRRKALAEDPNSRDREEEPVRSAARSQAALRMMPLMNSQLYA